VTQSRFVRVVLIWLVCIDTGALLALAVLS
jgi:hypothetical protein